MLNGDVTRMMKYGEVVCDMASRGGDWSLYIRNFDA